MKAYITIGFLLIAGTLSAQADSSYSDLLKRYKNPGIMKLKDQPQYDAFRKNQYALNMGSAKLLTTLPNGNKVYALPQDNMPCVVPPMHNTMPNAGNNSRIRVYPAPGAIPNPKIKK